VRLGSTNPTIVEAKIHNHAAPLVAK